MLYSIRKNLFFKVKVIDWIVKTENTDLIFDLEIKDGSLN
mgnify:CR=1 FL=1